MSMKGGDHHRTNLCGDILSDLRAGLVGGLGMVEKGSAIRAAIRTVLETRRDMVTADMGGSGTTDTFAEALVVELRN